MMVHNLHKVIYPFVVKWERSKRMKRPRVTWRFNYDGLHVGYNLNQCGGIRISL